MKNITIVFLLALFCSCGSGINQNNVVGMYYATIEQMLPDGTTDNDKLDLRLERDSSFTFDVQLAGSYFPATYAGTWSLREETVVLNDTTGLSKGEIHFAVNPDGSLAGNMGMSEFTFKRAGQ